LNKLKFMEWLSRTELLVGEENIEKLRESKVLVVGLGGVGAYAVEMLCRAGIGNMTIVDGDVVQASNRNRQLPALSSTEGKSKAQLMGDRLIDINPELKLTIIAEYIKDDRMIEILDGDFDYVVDAIDTMAPKIYLIYHSLQKGLNVVSSMGAGGKFDPSQIRVADIADSYNCTLARMLRKRLHRLGVRTGVQVVFSAEKHDKSKVVVTDGEQNKKSTVGTISYLPPMFGCFVASIVIREILDK
jgi:tRNA threonylcarbamoyladenosine dehydratase